MNNENLIQKIIRASHFINKANSSSGNYIILSPKIAKVLQDMDKYEKRKRIIEKLLKSDS